MHMSTEPEVDFAARIGAEEEFFSELADTSGIEFGMVSEGRGMGNDDPVFGVFTFRSVNDFIQKVALFGKELRSVSPQQMIARFPDGICALSGIEDDKKYVAVTEGIIGSAEVFRENHGIISPVFVIAAHDHHRFGPFVPVQFIEIAVKVVESEVVKVFGNITQRNHKVRIFCLRQFEHVGYGIFPCFRRDLSVGDDHECIPDSGGGIGGEAAR